MKKMFWKRKLKNNLKRQLGYKKLVDDQLVEILSPIKELMEKTENIKSMESFYVNGKDKLDGIGKDIFDTDIWNDFQAAFMKCHDKLMMEE